MNNCDFTAASQIAVGTACVPFSFNINTAMGAPANPGCLFGTGTGEDAWAWFTATATSTTVTYSNTNQDAMVFIYADNGTPCAGLTQIACADDWFGPSSESIAFPTTIGNKYYVRIVRYTGTSGQMNGSLCVFSPPPIANDPCSGAIPIACGQVVTGNTATAATDVVPGGCSSGFAGSPGLWYSITGDGSTYILDLCNSGYDTQVAVFTGGCNGLSCVTYSDDYCGFLSYATFNTVAGQVYYILVFGFSNFDSGPFEMIVDCYTEVANDPCTGAIPIACEQTISGTTAGFNLDNIPAGCGISYSAGLWYQFTGNGEFITASLCGSAFDTQISVFTGTCTSLACVDTNDDLCGLQSQVSFMSTAGTVYYILVHGYLEEGPFSLNIHCEPFVPTPQDCVGSSPICTDTQFGGNSSGSGFIEDIDINNYGCLASGENQSSWYVFQPTSTGVISFTINPTPVVDYDFAIWGPYSTPTCPPTGAPLRCSFSAWITATGLGNGAIDFSEGAGGDAWVAPITITAAEVNAYYFMCLDNFSSTTTPFVFDWSLSGVVLNCAIQLPVELTDFSGEQLGLANQLRWTTASEVNNERFEVLRSEDGIHYEKIGEVMGNGTSFTENEYVFLDRHPVSLVSYYQLRQVDFNGAFEMSAVLAVSRSATASVGPNPVEDMLHIQFSSSGKNLVEMRLTDIAGRLIRSQLLKEEQGVLEWNMKDLPPGMYQFCGYTEAGEMFFSQKIIRN